MIAVAVIVEYRNAGAIVPDHEVAAQSVLGQVIKGNDARCGGIRGPSGL